LDSDSPLLLVFCIWLVSYVTHSLYRHSFDVYNVLIKI